MKVLRHYLGILRLYSFVDLVLLLIVLKLPLTMLYGALLLWVGFLLLLESQHKHEYREAVPAVLAWGLLAIGLILYGRLEGILFLFLSYLYTLKNTKKWGMISPLIRGLQNLVLTAGWLGYQNPIIYIVGLVTLVRNLLGDLRDVKKDRNEGLKTLPVVWRLPRGWRYIHLAGVMASSTIWWLLGDLSPWVLAVVLPIEVTTYNLTPRGSSDTPQRDAYMR